MSEDVMDDLVRLYRQSAREAPTERIDTRILRAAATQAKMHRLSRRWLWPMAAAASIALWASVHGLSQAPQGAAGELMPGYRAGRIRADLLQMDVKPPTSDVARYLTGTAIVPDDENKETFP